MSTGIKTAQDLTNTLSAHGIDIIDNIFMKGRLPPEIYVSLNPMGYEGGALQKLANSFGPAPNLQVSSSNFNFIFKQAAENTPAPPTLTQAPQLIPNTNAPRPA